MPSASGRQCTPTMAEPADGYPQVAVAAAEAASASAPEASPKHVRFASLDLVHNLARRLSATFLIDDEQDGQHDEGDANAGDDAESSMFFDSNLSSELDHADGTQQQIPRNDERPTPVGNRNSIIFWRDVVPPPPTQAGRNAAISPQRPFLDFRPSATHRHRGCP